MRPSSPPSTRHAALAVAETLEDEETLAAARAGVVFDDFIAGRPASLDELERAVEVERRVGQIVDR